MAMTYPSGTSTGDKTIELTGDEVFKTGDDSSLFLEDSFDSDFHYFLGAHHISMTCFFEILFGVFKKFSIGATRTEAAVRNITSFKFKFETLSESHEQIFWFHNKRQNKERLKSSNTGNITK